MCTNPFGFYLERSHYLSLSTQSAPMFSNPFLLVDRKGVLFLYLLPLAPSETYDRG